MCAAKANFLPSIRLVASTIAPIYPIRAPSDGEQEITRLALQQLSSHPTWVNPTTAFYALSLEGRYILQEVAGSGTFGVAIRAISQDGLQVVIKISKQSGQDNFIKEFKSLQIAHDLSPDHTVRGIECRKHLNLSDCGPKARCCNDRVAIVTIYGGPTVQTRHRPNPACPMPATQFISFARQCIQFWADLAQENYVLRDIRPSNMLLDETGTVRFIDFGEFALHGASTMAWYGASRYYRSPTVLTKTFDRAEIPFALACVLFEVLTGKILFFTGIESSRTITTQTHLLTVFKLIGLPKPEWKSRFSEKYQKLFFSPAISSSDMHDSFSAFEAAIKNHRALVETKHRQEFCRHFIDLLLQLLAYDNPPTPEHILAHPFFKIAVTS